MNTAWTGDYYNYFLINIAVFAFAILSSIWEWALKQCQKKRLGDINDDV